MEVIHPFFARSRSDGTRRVRRQVARRLMLGMLRFGHHANDERTDQWRNTEFLQDLRPSALSQRGRFERDPAVGRFPLFYLDFITGDGKGRPMSFPRITHDPNVMGGKPCIRGLRITVATVVGLLASGESRERILDAYTYLESADLDEALAYAAWRLEEREEEIMAR